MLAGKVIQGLKMVKQFFPEATLPEKPCKGALNALEELGQVESPKAQDIVRIFDSNFVGVYGGTEIR